MSGVHQDGRVAWELQPSGAVIIKTRCDMGWQAVIDGATGHPIDISDDARRHRSSTWAGFHLAVDRVATAERILHDVEILGVDA